MTIDPTNWKILQILQRNARMSVSAISREVGVTSPAVAERIRKMEDASILIGYKAEVSHIGSGHQLKAIITLRAFMGRLKPFLEKVHDFSEVLNCYRITGNENIFMEVVLFDQFHLEEFIDKLITYGETKTHIVLSTVIENAPIRTRKEDRDKLKLKSGQIPNPKGNQ